MKKILRVTANTDGWYSIKASCDEGTIITNIKLEAYKPLELSFVNGRASIEADVEIKPEPVRENRDRSGYKNYDRNQNRRRYKNKGDST